MKTKEEIEQLAAREYWRNNVESRSFIKGYTQCAEDMADKKYTEEDIREAIDMARMLSHVSCLEDGEYRLKYSNTEEDIINSLNKQD
jgi:hypothetical protein